MPKDILHPFTGSINNRNETFLIECGSFIYNRSAFFVISMLQKANEYIKDFPNLKLFFNMSSYQIYEATKYFDPIQVLIELLPDDDDLPPDFNPSIIIKTINELDKVAIDSHLVPTMFSYALSNIANDKCCEKIYVMKHMNFTDSEIGLMNVIFGENRNKIELVSGDLFDIIVSMLDEVTSIFINDKSILEKLRDYVEEHGLQESVNKMLFMLKVNNQYIIENPDTGMHTYSKELNDFIAEMKKSNIHVGLIHPSSYLSENNHDIIYRE